MKIAHIRISNILGIEDLEFSAGAFNAITGPNGSGKTSMLEAIRSVVGRSDDATLLRKGAEQGQAVLVLDDGTELKRRFTQRGSILTVEDKHGQKVPSPATFVRGLADMLGSNPIDFLKAPKKDRVRVLLECLPLTADIDRLSRIMGQPLPVAEASALERIDLLHKATFDDRTFTNRALREKQGAINQLADTLPPPGEEPPGSPIDLTAQIDAIEAASRLRHAEVDGKMAEYRAESAVRMDAMQAEIDALRDKQTKEREWLATAESGAAMAKAKADTEAATAKAPFAAQLTAIQSNTAAAARAQATRENIEKMKAEVADLAADAEHQSKILIDLEAYKLELLGALPIDGLTVTDGEIFRNGVPFDRLNKAQQVEISVEIAKLRAGALGMICVDELEMLDTEHFEAFRDQALASGLQLFVTRVSDAQFGIHAEG